MPTKHSSTPARTTPRASGQPVHELVLNDLDCCKATYIKRHRRTSPHYENLPVWAAAEALSFVTLSKCIEHGNTDNVARTLADDFGVNRQGFSSQIRFLVSLRNQCAHHSRPWNDVAKNAPRRAEQPAASRGEVRGPVPPPEFLPRSRRPRPLPGRPTAGRSITADGRRGDDEHQRRLQGRTDEPATLLIPSRTHRRTG